MKGQTYKKRKVDAFFCIQVNWSIFNFEGLLFLS